MSNAKRILANTAIALVTGISAIAGTGAGLASADGVSPGTAVVDYKEGGHNSTTHIAKRLDSPSHLPVLTYD